MQAQSNQDAYVVQSTINMAVSVNTRYVDSDGHFNVEPTNQFEILFYKNTSCVKPMADTLKQWVSFNNYPGLNQFRLLANNSLALKPDIIAKLTDSTKVFLETSDCQHEPEPTITYHSNKPLMLVRLHDNQESLLKEENSSSSDSNVPIVPAQVAALDSYSKQTISKSFNGAHATVDTSSVARRSVTCQPPISASVIMSEEQPPVHVINTSWKLSRLYRLFEAFYLESTYERELISEFNTREQLILCKLLKVSARDITRAMCDTSTLAAIADEYFCNDTKRKGYKITNNKRFVFRKIRGLLYKQLQPPALGFRDTKKNRDARFFTHYFANAPEYMNLTTGERADLQSLLRTYEESKISVIWKFKTFTTDFSRVFFDFPHEMVHTYYQKKVNALRFCLEYMNEMEEENILRSSVPIKCLPRPLNVVKQYMADFFNSFGDKLVKGPPKSVYEK